MPAEPPVGNKIMEEIALSRFGKSLDQLTAEEFHQIMQALGQEQKQPTYVVADGGKSSIQGLTDHVEKRERKRLKLDETDPKNALPEPPQGTPLHMPSAAAKKQTMGFADLLMLIEREAPGVPAEMGRRLYKADGVVSR